LLHCCHRPERLVREHGEEDHDQGDPGIEIEPDRRHQDPRRTVHAILVQQAQQVRAPAIEQDQHADWRTGRVDNIGQALAADLQLVEQWTPENAGGQQADIGLDKDQHAANRCDQTGAARGRGKTGILQALNHGADPAGPVHVDDQRTNDQAEEQDARIVGAVKHAHSTVNAAKRAHERIEPGNQGLAQPDGQSQRPEHITGPDRDNDRDNGRRDRQPVHGRLVQDIRRNQL